MTDKAEQIARSLTEAQRGCLAHFTETPIWWFPAHHTKRTRQRLIEAGLLESRTVNPRDFPLPMQGLALTPLGLAVREILIRESQS